jgi:hypothetical protein
MLRHVLIPALLLQFAPSARAAAEADCGFLRLKAALGSAMPTGAGVPVSLVEVGPAYLPQAGTGTFAGSGIFAGRTFTAKSGTSAFSGHANRTAQHLFGPFTSEASGPPTMAPGITLIDCYEANAFLEDGFLRPTALNAAPLTENSRVQSCSWVGSADAASAAGTNDVVRRLDFAIHRDNYLCTVGVNNGSGNRTPELVASAYNVLSVGLTNGNHSRGPTSSFVDGPGRLKPEIVAPFDVTSWATPYVGSAGAILRQRAAQLSSVNAARGLSIKAFLLAGATKSEFPGWSKSSTVPLDSIFGAGELEVFNSEAILSGTEQLPNQATPRPAKAWDYHTLAASTPPAVATADYRLSIPPGTIATELSAFLVWNRTITGVISGGSFAPSPDALVDFNLALELLPSDGSSPVTVDQSNSSIYNLEHVWKKNLPAGNYRLRVSRGTGSTREFAIAWRMESAPHVPAPSMNLVGDSAQLSFRGTLPTHRYEIHASSDMVSWSTIHSFTADSSTSAWNAPASSRRLFYRLVPVAL